MLLVIRNRRRVAPIPEVPEIAFGIHWFRHSVSPKPCNTYSDTAIIGISVLFYVVSILCSVVLVDW